MSAAGHPGDPGRAGAAPRRHPAHRGRICRGKFHIEDILAGEQVVPVADHDREALPVLLDRRRGRGCREPLGDPGVDLRHRKAIAHGLVLVNIQMQRLRRVFISRGNVLEALDGPDFRGNLLRNPPHGFKVMPVDIDRKSAGHERRHVAHAARGDSHGAGQVGGLLLNGFPKLPHPVRIVRFRLHEAGISTVGACRRERPGQEARHTRATAERADILHTLHREDPFQSFVYLFVGFGPLILLRRGDGNLQGVPAHIRQDRDAHGQEPPGAEGQEPDGNGQRRQLVPEAEPERPPVDVLHAFKNPALPRRKAPENRAGGRRHHGHRDDERGQKAVGNR